MTNEQLKHRFFKAAEAGNARILKECLDQGISIDEKNRFNHTALHYACDNGHFKAAELLLRRGAKPEAECAYLPLSSAISKGYDNLAALLLEGGADPDFSFPDQREPLYFAVDTGRISAVELLLHWGADPNAAHALISACRKGYAGIARLLIDHGADANLANEYGNTPLSETAKTGDVDLFEFLLKSGAKPNPGTKDGYLPWVIAWENGHPEIADRLERLGAGYKALRSSFGPFNGFCRNGNLKAVQIMIENGCELDRINGAYGTPLFSSIFKGHTEIAKLLFSAGANPNIPFGDKTPLSLAIEKNNTDIIRHFAKNPEKFVQKEYKLLLELRIKASLRQELTK